MSFTKSLQGRLMLWLGLALTVVWVVAANVTAYIARSEIEEVFDSALQETAQRILPLAVVDILSREEEGINQRVAAIGDHTEFFTYVVTDERGRILLQSHTADPDTFAEWRGVGFSTTDSHRLYSDEAVKGTIRITVAEPLEHRASVSHEIQRGLGLPLLIMLPLALGAIVFAVRASLAPVRRYRMRLSARSERDLSPINTDDLPTEIASLAETLNGLLGRLETAFDAERSFAANAAHELRTPLAGAIAQAQRLQSETSDPDAKARAGEIETTLKRLTRLAERLMQLARAEGAKLRRNDRADLRPITELIIDDLSRTAAPARIVLSLPDTAVLSDLEPDALAIILRNLVENAVRHGQADAPIEVVLSADGTFSVSNEGPVVPEETLARLTHRFERGDGTQSTGSGLGLAIVRSIAERTGGAFDIRSPRRSSATGFEARFRVTGASGR